MARRTQDPRSHSGHAASPWCSLAFLLLASPGHPPWPSPTPFSHQSPPASAGSLQLSLGRFSTTDQDFWAQIPHLPPALTATMMLLVHGPRFETRLYRVFKIASIWWRVTRHLYLPRTTLRAEHTKSVRRGLPTGTHGLVVTDT